MRARAALLLVSALLAAGCAGAPARPTPTTGDPPAASGPPAAATPPPSPPGEDCGEMTLTAEPTRVRPGEEVVFHGTFRNCGDAPLRYDHGCLTPPWHPTVEANGTTYHVGANGSAVEMFACPAILIHASLPPGEALERTWRWNGTFRECHDDHCLPFDAAPGIHRFTSRLLKDVGLDKGGKAWNASVEVEVLPRG